MLLIMTKIAIVTHRTGVSPKVVFHGANDEAIKFFKAFKEPGELSLFYCRSAERTKKIAAPAVVEPAPEPVKPTRRKSDGLL
jgi:hypothetical protein